MLLTGVAGTQAATPQGAEQAYQQGDFAKSQQEYAATAAKQAAKAELQFNTGSAAYKAGDYAQAAAGFQQSLKTEQVPVQHDAYYNLGNTQYRLGQETEQTHPHETIKTWEEAVKSYDAALQIAANDPEAKHNRDLVQRKIEQLKKQEEQKQEDQQKQRDQKDQQQKQDQQGNNDQKDQSQDQPQADAKSGKAEQPKPVDPAKKPSQGQAEAANGAKPEDAQAAAEAAAENERGEPGQMTKAEAKQLLNALKGDERKVPAVSAQGRAAGQPNDHTKLQDW